MEKVCVQNILIPAQVAQAHRQYPDGPVKNVIIHQIKNLYVQHQAVNNGYALNVLTEDILILRNNMQNQ